MATFGPNLLPNPGAETDVTGWTAPNATGGPVRVTTPVRSGVGAFRVTAASVSNLNLLAADVTTGLTAGKLVKVSGWVRSSTVARSCGLLIDWYSATGYVSTAGVGGVTSTTASWTEVTGEVLMPASATKASLYGQVTGHAAAEVHYWDDFSLAAETTTAPPPSTAADCTARIGGVTVPCRTVYRLGGVLVGAPAV